LARLRQDVIGEGSGDHGEQVVAAVAKRLSAEYRRGFSKRNLHCALYAALRRGFPDAAIVHALRAQLSVTHLCEIVAFDELPKR
jgi:hypothetical protein